MSAIQPFRLKPTRSENTAAESGSDEVPSTLRGRLTPARGMLFGVVIGLAAWAIIIGLAAVLWRW